MAMDDVYTKPGHLIRRLQQISVSIFMEECAAFDVTPVQYASLVAIREYPGIDATRLSSVIAFDRSTLGSVIERLEAKKWIARVNSRDDKRVKLLQITKAGEKTLRQVEPSVQRCQARILAPIAPSGRRQFMTLLNQLVERNNDISRAPLKLANER